MYILLKGAKKNVGDFFIFERAKKLLMEFTKEKDFVEFNRWEPLDEKLDIVNKAKAVILCGGPGYSKFFYPKVFPLTPDLSRIKVPIIPFGLGWVGKPAASPENFTFSSQSLDALKFIHSKIPYSSCRDILTKEILKRAEINNVIMTGCPTWYDLGSIGKKLDIPTNIRKVVVTTAQDPIYYQQNKQLLTGLKKLLKKFNENVQLYAVFHRGWEKDEFTSGAQADSLQKLKNYAEGEGYKTINAAYGLEKIDFYNDCDFHVGYRVHAQIYFLSIRKPSFLLWEDGRGIGLSKSLDLPDVPAMNLRTLRFTDKINMFVPKFNKISTNKILENLFVDRSSVDQILDRVEVQIKSNFEGFESLPAKLDKNFEEMKRFIKTLPA